MSPIGHVGDESILDGVFEEELAKLLKVSTLEMRQNWKDAICTALKIAYENEPGFVYVIGLDILPGEQAVNSVGIANDAGFMATGDSSLGDSADRKAKAEKVREAIEKLPLAAIAQANPRKRTFLNVALQWGCQWAKDERKNVEECLRKNSENK